MSQKNDTGVAHYNFDANQPILIIFGIISHNTAAFGGNCVKFTEARPIRLPTEMWPSESLAI